MRIIGHRGAAGLELENTLASLQKAKDLGVDAIEFDVHATEDRHLLLSHDANLIRVSGQDAKIADHPLAFLKRITLRNGEQPPTLEEALDLTGKTPVIIESKVNDIADELLAVLDKYPDAPITIASRHHSLIAEIQTRRPEVRTYLVEYLRSVEIFRDIKYAQADGFDMNAWLLNPYTYWIARRRGLEMMVFTINHRFVAWFIKKLYPEVMLCTDHPERFVKSGKAKD